MSKDFAIFKSGFAPFLGPIMKHKLPLAHIYIGLARGIYFYFHWFPVVYIYV